MVGKLSLRHHLPLFTFSLFATLLPVSQAYGACDAADYPDLDDRLDCFDTFLGIIDANMGTVTVGQTTITGLISTQATRLNNVQNDLATLQSDVSQNASDIAAVVADYLSSADLSGLATESYVDGSVGVNTSALAALEADLSVVLADYLTSADETLGGLSCADGDIPLYSYDAGGWVCEFASDVCLPSTRISCLSILEAGESTGDGTYWIDPDGAGEFEVYCDMTTDAGGWTLLAQGGVGTCSGMSSSDDMTDSDSCAYLAFDTISALAGSASEVMLQVGGNSSTFGDWTGCHAEPCTTVSQDSLAVSALTSSTGTWDNGATWSEWDWSYSCPQYMNDGWPNMFQACGNGDGVHWIADNPSGDYYHNSDGDGASGAHNLISATWMR